MSSFNTHARNVLDDDLAITNRWPHLRSCMNKVSNLANLNRVEIVELIKENTELTVKEMSQKKI